jgi:aspartate/methionine/tyrosine aminotransferase
MEAEDFCEDLVKKKDVLLVPSTKFGYGNHHFRLGFGRKNMPDGLKLLQEYVEEKLSKWFKCQEMWHSWVRVSVFEDR